MSLGTAIILPDRGVLCSETLSWNHDRSFESDDERKQLRFGRNIAVHFGGWVDESHELMRKAQDVFRRALKARQDGIDALRRLFAALCLKECPEDRDTSRQGIIMLAALPIGTYGLNVTAGEPALEFLVRPGDEPAISWNAPSQEISDLAAKVLTPAAVKGKDDGEIVRMLRELYRSAEGLHDPRKCNSRLNISIVRRGYMKTVKDKKQAASGYVGGANALGNMASNLSMLPLMYLAGEQKNPNPNASAVSGYPPAVPTNAGDLSYINSTGG